MTQSLAYFHRALGEAKQLSDCYQELNGHESVTPPDALKKASLILALTAWETYVEDVATELFNQQFGIL